MGSALPGNVGCRVTSTHGHRTPCSVGCRVLSIHGLRTPWQCRVPTHAHTRAPHSQAMSGAESCVYMGSTLPGNIGCRVFISLRFRRCLLTVPVRLLTLGPDSLLSWGPQTNLCRAPRTQVMMGPAYAVTSGPVYSLRMGSASCDCHYISPRTNSFPSDTSLQCTSRCARWREEWSRKTCLWYWCSCLCSTWLLLP